MTTAVARTGSLPEGFENFGTHDMILPVYRIVQPVTQDVEPKFIGQFINATTKEVAPSLSVVILKWQHTRSFFANLGDKSPVCSSDDGLHPRKAGIKVGDEIIPQECAACPFAQWLNDAPPPCKSGYMLICATADTGEKFIYRAMGTSAAPVKRLLNQIIAKKVAIFGVVVKLASVKGESTKGNYYVLQPTIEKVLPQDEALGWRSDYLAVKGAALKEASEEEPIFDEAPPADEIPY